MNMLDDDKKRMSYENGRTVRGKAQGYNIQDEFTASNEAFIKKIKEANTMTFEGFGRRLKERDRNKYVESEIREKAKIAKQLGLDFTEEYYKQEIGIVPRDKKAEGKLVGNQKKIDANNDGKITGDDFKLLQKAEGGSMDDQMLMVMTPPMESNMESDDDMEDNYTKFIMEEALNEEEEDMLTSKLEQDEQLSMLFDKIIDVAQEFAGSGPVEGPGSGVSDSIPARLSDGEFVFTAKAVEEIGEDTLMSMMKDAEAAVDERQNLAVGGMPVMQEEMQKDQFGNSIESDIADDEIRKGMLSTNPRLK